MRYSQNVINRRRFKVRVSRRFVLFFFFLIDLFLAPIERIDRFFFFFI